MKIKRLFSIQKFNSITLLLLSIIFYPANILNAQWAGQSSGVNTWLSDICFVDSLYGWAVGDSGIIISTTNGGKNWIKQFDSVDTIEFKQVQFLNRNSGFVGGNIIKKFPYYQAYQTFLLRTTDGGFSWERLDYSFDPEVSFRYMLFFNLDDGYIGINNIGSISMADRKGMLLKTSDGGVSWTVLQEKDALLIGSFIFENSSFGYSFWSLSRDNYDDTEVYNTQNAGLNWIQVGIIQEEIIKKVICVSPSSIWTIGLNGIGRSVDSGQTWYHWNLFSPVPIGEKRIALSDIEISGSDTIWLVGSAFTSPYDIEGVLFKTTNSGENWNLELQVPYYSFSALSIVNDSKAWISGRDGFIIHTENIVTNTEKESGKSIESFKLSQNYPNPFNPSTTIKYDLPKSSVIKLSVYNLLGEEIKVLEEGYKQAESYETVFDASNLPSGVYVYRLVTENFSTSKKMILIK